MDLDNENPWEGVLASTMFAIQSTVHTSYAAYTIGSQLVFGRDAILYINQEANWQLIKQRKQTLINEGIQKEYCHRQSHVYHTGDKVLLKNVWKTKFNQDAYIGPYTVTEVWNNGTVRACRSNITDTYKLCNIIPLIDFHYGAVCHRQVQVLSKLNSKLTIQLVQMTFIHIVDIVTFDIS